MKNKEYALNYLKNGFSVFPTRGKKPLISWEKYSKGRPTEQEVIDWWTKWSDADIAVATGSVSKLVVIDIDGGKVPQLPPTTVSETSSGHYQYFFKHPGFPVQNSVKVVDSNIDIRGDGGFCVLPPSKHFNKEGKEDFTYTWKIPPKEGGFADLPQGVLEKVKVKKPLESIVRGVSQGSRNTDAATFIGSLLVKYPQDQWESICWPMVVGWDKTNNPPLGERELRSVFDSISSRELLKENALNESPKTMQHPWPSPLDNAAYHGIAGEFVKLIEPESEADPVALLVNFLTAFCSVVGPKPYHLIEADKHKMQIFATLVGKSSKGRKGTSWSYITNAFFLVDPVWKSRVQSGLSSGEGVIWAVRDPIKKTEPIKENKQIIDYREVVTDPGIEDKRLLVMESEFASTLRVLNREGNTLSPVIRDAWDHGRLQSLTKNSPASSESSHISILGHITIEELLRFLSVTESFNGFANRFLWVCSRRSKLKPHGGDIDQGTFNNLVSRLREIVEFAKEVGPIKLDDQTYQLWSDIYSYLSEEIPGLLGAVKGRAEAYVKRLACIYALLDKSDVVKLPHLRAAVALWDYVDESIDFIFQGKTGDAIAERILEALSADPEGLSKEQISNEIFNRNKSSEEISFSLDLLESVGKIKKQTLKTQGRDKTIYTLISSTSSTSYPRLKKRYLEYLDEFVNQRDLKTTGQAQNNKEHANEINEINEKSLNNQNAVDAINAGSKEGNFEPYPY